METSGVVMTLLIVLLTAAVVAVAMVFSRKLKRANNDLDTARREARKALKQLRRGILADLDDVRDEMSGMKLDVKTVRKDVTGVRDEVSGVQRRVTGVWNDVAGVKSDVYEVRTVVDELPDQMMMQLQNPSSSINRLCIGQTCMYEPEASYMKRNYASTVVVPEGTWLNAASIRQPTLTISRDLTGRWDATGTSWTLTDSDEAVYLLVQDARSPTAFDLYDEYGNKTDTVITFVAGATTLTYSGETAGAGIYTKAPVTSSSATPS
jgi:hypothetical protein